MRWFTKVARLFALVGFVGCLVSASPVGAASGPDVSRFPIFRAPGEAPFVYSNQAVHDAVSGAVIPAFTALPVVGNTKAAVIVLDSGDGGLRAAGLRWIPEAVAVPVAAPLPWAVTIHTVTLAAAPNGPSLDTTIPAWSYVRLIAAKSGWYDVGYIDDEGIPHRGWVPASDLASAGSPAAWARTTRNTPIFGGAQSAQIVTMLPAGFPVRVLTIQKDGRREVYVQTGAGIVGGIGWIDIGDIQASAPPSGSAFNLPTHALPVVSVDSGSVSIPVTANEPLVPPPPAIIAADRAVVVQLDGSASATVFALANGQIVRQFSAYAGLPGAAIPTGDFVAGKKNGMFHTQTFQATDGHEYYYPWYVPFGPNASFHGPAIDDRNGNEVLGPMVLSVVPARTDMAWLYDWIRAGTPIRVQDARGFVPTAPTTPTAVPRPMVGS